MVLRAMRPSRFVTCSLKFAAETLGKKVVTESSLDLSSVVKTLSPRTPVLLIYREEPENAKFLITDLACKRQVRDAQRSSIL